MSTPSRRVSAGLAVDLLGFGDSPRPWARYTVDRHLEALHGALPSSGRVCLVGHSMGATLALAYAARHPERVERLVLISFPFFGPRTDARSIVRRQLPGGWFFTNIALAAAACLLTRRVVGPFLPRLLPAYPRDVLRGTLRHGTASFVSSLWRVVYGHDPALDVERLGPQIEVVCIHGDRDRTAPVAGVRALAEARANWRLIELEGAGHHPLLFQQLHCEAAILEALSEPGYSVGPQRR